MKRRDAGSVAVRAYLSTAQNAAFGRDMTVGQGDIALAAPIFGKWRPVPTMLACLLFGFLDALGPERPLALVHARSPEPAEAAARALRDAITRGKTAAPETKPIHRRPAGAATKRKTRS